MVSARNPLYAKLTMFAKLNYLLSCYHVPCIRLARGKFKLINQDSAGGKKFTVLTPMKVDRKGIEIRQLFSLRWHKIFTKGDLQFPKPYHIAKRGKKGNILCLQLLIWGLKW